MSTLDRDEEDLTRKQRREQARAKRRELEEAEAASAVRRRRLTQLGIIAAAVVAVVVIVAVVASGGSSGGGVPKSTAQQNKVKQEVNKLIGGIPENGNVLGSPNAPVTLAYFGDLECPICREFTLGAFPSIIQKWVRSGKVRVEYRSLETATREPETFRTQQTAALAAGKQNKMWYFVELFYHEQGKENTEYVNEEYLDTLARQVPGLNQSEWKSARNESQWGKQIEEDAQVASNQAFNGTPSFLLGRSGSALKKLPETPSLTEPGSFDSAIESVLKG